MLPLVVLRNVTAYARHNAIGASFRIRVPTIALVAYVRTNRSIRVWSANAIEVLATPTHSMEPNTSGSRKASPVAITCAVSSYGSVEKIHDVSRRKPQSERTKLIGAWCFDMTNEKAKRLKDAIRRQTVEAPDGGPNGPTEAAFEALGNVFQKLDTRDPNVRAAHDEFAKLGTAMVADCRLLRQAADEYFNENFLVHAVPRDPRCNACAEQLRTGESREHGLVHTC